MSGGKEEITGHKKNRVGTLKQSVHNKKYAALARRESTPHCFTNLTPVSSQSVMLKMHNTITKRWEINKDCLKIRIHHKLVTTKQIIIA